MSETFTDFVIQISTSGSESDTAARKGEDSRLITELQRCLQPGVEIALVFEGYTAITSILWLSEPQADGSVRARVRLLGVSAQLDEPSHTASTTDKRSPRTFPAHWDSAIIAHHF